MVLRESLPIKCVEAVFVALYLTAGIDGLERVPLAFKTTVGKHTFRHIVLAVHHRDRKDGTSAYGALGISRRKELMFKELAYPTMSALTRSFVEGYERWWHRVSKVRLGLPVSHDVHSNERVVWRRLTVTGVSGRDWETQVAPTIDDFASKAGALATRRGGAGDAPTVVSAGGSDGVDAHAEDEVLSDGEVDTRPPRKESLASARGEGSEGKAKAKAKARRASDAGAHASAGDAAGDADARAPRRTSRRGADQARADRPAVATQPAAAEAPVCDVVADVVRALVDSACSSSAPGRAGEAMRQGGAAGGGGAAAPASDCDARSDGRASTSGDEPSIDAPPAPGSVGAELALELEHPRVSFLAV